MSDQEPKRPEAPQPTKIEVDGWCHMCPLWEGEWGTCNADPERRESTTESGAADWCPLRKGPVLVTMRAPGVPT